MKISIMPAKRGQEISGIVQLIDAKSPVEEMSLSEILQPRLGRLSPYLRQINQVVVGATGVINVDFLQYLPNATSVRILTPTVKSIDGLRWCSHIKSLRIERPTCRMEVLGELESLENLYIDDWRLGAHSIFRLRNLTSVGIQKYGLPDLQGMSNWKHLRVLWMNAGKLEELGGIPSNIRRLELSNFKKLDSLTPLSACRRLEELVLQSCRRVTSLDGISECRELRILSIPRGGNIESLEPIRDLKRLEHLVLAGGTQVQGPVSCLYSLPNLQKLVIPRQSGLDKGRIAETAPDCEVHLI